MNTQAYEAGSTAYNQGNFSQAADLLSQAKQPGEVSGQIDHLLGNCHMRMGRFEEAAAAYGDALRDPAYGHSGALACNRGRALLAAGRLQDAIASLTMATKDPSYGTPYKAYVALGDAYLAAGDARDAGVAYRNAAIDETNPTPSVALNKLGGCFMKLGRAVDAIEAYRTALDFAGPNEDQNKIFANMGMAYVAANRMPEASDAFTRATSDGTYQLTNEERVSAEAARKALAGAANGGPSETDALLAAAGYGGSGLGAKVDPLDPLGKSGEFMPSPEDTGFFSLDEEEVIRGDKKARRKHRHTGVRVLFTILFLLIILAGGAAYAYYCGYGWPLQEDVAKQVMLDYSAGGDVSSLISATLADDAKSQLTASLPMGVSEVTSTAVTNRSMTASSVLVNVKLEGGGELAYTVDLVRDMLGWKVVSVTPENPTLGGQPATTTTTTTTTSTTTTAPATSEAAPATTTDAANAEG